MNPFGCSPHDEGAAGDRDVWWRSLCRWTIGPIIIIALLGLIIGVTLAFALVNLVWVAIAWPVLWPWQRHVQRQLRSNRSSPLVYERKYLCDKVTFFGWYGMKRMWQFAIGY